MKGGSNGNANNGGVTHNGEEQIYKWEVFTPLESMPIIKGTILTVVVDKNNREHSNTINGYQHN